MHYLSWLARFLGVPIDYDGADGPQCVDAVNSYLTLERGVHAVSGNAVDIARQRIAGAVWVANTPTNAPSPGDVVVWQGGVPALGIGQYGHCAIALLADSVTLLSADQNWAGHRYLAVQLHTYVGVLGWHHFAE